MATKYAHLPALVDENGVMVGYVDANGKERSLDGALVPPGTTPTPGGGITSADITDSGATGRLLLQSANPGGARLVLGVIATTNPPQDSGPTALTGSGTTASAVDHVHRYPSQLLTGRTFSLTGGATGTSAAFTGAANASIPVTLATPTETVRGGVLAQPAIADSAGAPTMAEFNAVLAALRAAGVVLSA